MRKFDKIRSGAAVLSMMLVVSAGLTACGSEQPASSPVDNTENVTVEAVETEPATEAESKIVVSIDSEIVYDDAMVSELAAQFPEYDITVCDVDAHYTMDVEEYKSNVSTVFMRSIEEVARDKASGKFADITDIANARGYFDNMSDEAKAMFTDENGKVFAIPSYTYSLALMCNTDLFVEAGLTDDEGNAALPTTWDEAMEAAQAIAEKTGKAGFAFIGQDDVTAAWHYINMAYNFGADDFCVKNADGTYTANINSEGAVAAMNYLKALKWEKNVLTESPEAEDFYSIIEAVANGEAGMCISSTDCISIFTSLGMESLAVATIPVAADNAANTVIYGSVIAFSADASTEEIEAALDCIEYLDETAKPDDTALAGIDASLDGQYVNAFSVENIKSDNAIMGSDLYIILSGVINKVMTEENADVSALMEEANADLQSSFDVVLN